MKIYEFNGGTLALDLPDIWTQDADDDEAVFYSDAADSGVLRVKAQSLHNRDKAATEDDVCSILGPLADRLDPEAIHEIETLSGGQQCISFVRRFLEDATPHITATWVVGMITNPHVVQIALLTYVVPAQYARSAATIHELHIVEEAAGTLIGSAPAN